MIRIKDYIFNGNEIKMFVDGERIKVVFKNDTHIYIDAKYDDIEWNYEKYVENEKIEEAYKKVKEELAFMTSLQTDSLGKRLELSNKIEELEEENKKLKDKIEKAKLAVASCDWNNKFVLEVVDALDAGEE